MDKKQRFTTLNDQLRCNHVGGKVLITAGIQALGAEGIADILDAVAAFSAFNADNDPWGEHDCAVLNVDELRIIFKIDYYDRDLQFASSDPSDEHVTTRVLTIMLAEEY